MFFLELYYYFIELNSMSFSRHTYVRHTQTIFKVSFYDFLTVISIIDIKHTMTVFSHWISELSRRRADK